MPRHGQGINPYPNGNFATNLDFLEELILISSAERGKEPIDENDGGYQDIAIDGSSAGALTVPEDAISALIMIEADSSDPNISRVVRFKENGVVPTSNSGFGLGDNDVYTIVGKENLDRFRIVGITQTKEHMLRVQYFKSQQKKK